jgi:WD40 repeat protein
LRRFREEAGVNCLAVSADGSLVAAAGGGFLASGQAVSLWDAKTYARLAPVGEHDDEIGAVALSPDGRWLASGSADCTTLLWELPSGREAARLKHPAWVQGLAFAPDGGTLAVAVGRRVVLWDVRERRQRAALTGHRNTVLSVAFTPDGRALLSGSRDGSVRRWVLADGGRPANFRWKVGSVEAVVCAPDGMTAAAGGDSGTIVVWDLED